MDRVVYGCIGGGRTEVELYRAALYAATGHH